MSYLADGLFLQWERNRFLFLSVLYTPAARCVLYQTPGRRPPHFTGRLMDTVTLAWAGAPNERAPFRFHVAVVVYCRSMSVEDSESCRFQLNNSLTFSQDDEPNMRPGLIFLAFFERLGFCL